MLPTPNNYGYPQVPSPPSPGFNQFYAPSPNAFVPMSPAYMSPLNPYPINPRIPDSPIFNNQFAENQNPFYQDLINRRERNKEYYTGGSPMNTPPRSPMNTPPRSPMNTPPRYPSFNNQYMEMQVRNPPSFNQRPDDYSDDRSYGFDYPSYDESARSSFYNTNRHIPEVDDYYTPRAKKIDNKTQNQGNDKRVNHTSSIWLNLMKNDKKPFK